MTPIQLNVRVYKTEKRARNYYDMLKRVDKDCADWAKRLPKIEYKPDYKRWTVSYMVVYERKRRSRKK